MVDLTRGWPLGLGEKRWWLTLVAMLGILVLAVLFGCNMGYATPMADNCNLLVYSAGNHRFNDFMRVGAPLTIIMWLALSWILPQFYPLN